jgi:large subunit ribosomal protein L23
MPDRLQAVIRPVVTEKSSAQYTAMREYTFEADLAASKQEIREAIETMFGVHVVQVRTLIQPAKRRTRGRTEGRRKRWKKAYVRLAGDETIEGVFEG